MRRLLAVGMFVAAIACSSPAYASLIQYEFSGSVTTIFSDLGAYLPGVQVGTPLTGLLTYDPTIGFQDPLITGFNVTALQVSVGDFDITGTFPNGSPGFFWWSGLSIFQIAGPKSPSFISDFLSIQWNASNPTGSPGELFVQGLAASDDMRAKAFTGSITQFAPVPEAGAGTGFLLLFALSGIYAVSRFRLAGVRPPR